MTLLREAGPTGAEYPYSEHFLDYARMSDEASMDALRFRLAALGTEGDNAIDTIGELRSNYVQNVQGEECHLVVGRLPEGTLRLSCLEFRDVTKEDYDHLESNLASPHLADLMDESGRGSSMMTTFSTACGINRLTNRAGKNIGIELWFDVRPDSNFPDHYNLKDL